MKTLTIVRLKCSQVTNESRNTLTSLVMLYHAEINLIGHFGQIVHVLVLRRQPRPKGRPARRDGLSTVRARVAARVEQNLPQSGEHLALLLKHLGWNTCAATKTD